MTKETNFDMLTEEVKTKTDIVEVIGKYVNLDRNYKALCPFHKESHPSFSVKPDGQYFHCFGCRASGDVFDFLMRYENKSFMEVLTELAQDAGVQLPHLTDDVKKSLSRDWEKEDILTKTAAYYHQNLLPEIREHLMVARGFTDETIDKHQIGYAYGGLKQHLLDHCGFPLDLCLEAGVLKMTNDEVVRDYFYNRIIFPNIRRGRVVHLSGRAVDEQEPKYLHLPGKIHYFFNEDALGDKTIFIAEGIPDCISATQLGYPTIGIYGVSNFNPEHLQKLSHCKTIYLCMDGDKAGRDASLKIGGLIGERARIIQLPDGSDLNDYFRGHNQEDFDRLVSDAIGIVEYELSLIPIDTDKTELPAKLEPVMKELVKMEPAKAEAYLTRHIKKRFTLKNKDIDEYRRAMKRLRVKGENTANIQQSDSDTHTIYSANFDGLVDLVEYNGAPSFLVKEGDKITIQSKVWRDSVFLVPPPKNKIPWLLPRGDEVLKYFELDKTLPGNLCDSTLYDSLLEYHKRTSELPGEEYYDLIAAWVLHTYMLENFQYSPIICLYAVPERGKSRTGRGMTNLAYHGIRVESLRESYIFRLADNFQASIFFDVMDIWKKAERNQSEDILLARFERGIKVPRVLYPDRGDYEDTEYYDTFGPTIVSTNKGVHQILETRAIQINMPETCKKFENDVTPELVLPLKERLVAFRARHLGEFLPDIAKPASGRLGDILKPILQMILLAKPEQESSFLKLVTELQSDRLNEKSETFEAQILNTVVELGNQVEKGILPIKIITETFNKERAEKEHFTNHRMGWALKSLGFKKGKTNNGASAIVWNQKDIDLMITKYGLNKTSETSEISELPAT